MHPVPVVQAHLEQRLPMLQTGVVDQDLDRADTGFDGIDTLPHLVLIGDVKGLRENRFLAELARPAAIGSVRAGRD